MVNKICVLAGILISILSYLILVKDYFYIANILDKEVLTKVKDTEKLSKAIGFPMLKFGIILILMPVFTSFFGEVIGQVIFATLLILVGINFLMKIMNIESDIIAGKY